MRILLVAHHRLAPGGGVANATLALAGALRGLGHTVDTWGHDDAFGAHDPALARLRFPFRVARHLRINGTRYDVVDATTGDAWRYLARRRGRGPTMITRAHGLEHVADEGLRAHAQVAGARRGWKYPIYTGGYRLWEVRRSLQLADGAVALNAVDAEYMASRLGVARDRILTVPNGIPDAYFTLAAPDEASSRAVPLRIAFVGAWIPRKGIAVVAATLNALAARGVDYAASLLGTGAGTEAMIRAGLDAGARRRTTVVEAYAADALPRLLVGTHLLLHPSWTEGFSLALAEAMACGVAPVATPAGAAWDLVRAGESGVRVDAGATDCADAVMALDRDRATLHALRVGARHAVADLQWPTIAARTAAFYDARRAAAGSVT